MNTTVDKPMTYEESLVQGYKEKFRAESYSFIKDDELEGEKCVDIMISGGWIRIKQDRVMKTVEYKILQDSIMNLTKSDLDQCIIYYTKKIPILWRERSNPEIRKLIRNMLYYFKQIKYFKKEIDNDNNN